MLARPPIADTTSTPLTRRRALFELTLAYSLILLVIWTPSPIQRILYFVTVVTIAAMLALSFESAKSLGLRRTNLVRSLWIVLAAFLLAASLIVIAIHFNTLNAPHGVSHFIARYWGYAIWAFVQQVLLLDIFLRRMLILIPSPRRAALATALIFAIAHLPNPILTPVTFVWGFISCLLFLHYRNIIPLAIAHATLGITLAITVPSPLIRNMRVGLGCLHYRTRVPHVSLLRHGFARYPHTITAATSTTPYPPTYVSPPTHPPAAPDATPARRTRPLSPPTAHISS